MTIALLYVAFWAPSVVLAGPAGLLADRYDPRRVLLLASVAQATVAVALALVTGTALMLALAVLPASASPPPNRPSSPSSPVSREKRGSPSRTAGSRRPAMRGSPSAP
jgi:MFS family permease